MFKRKKRTKTVIVGLDGVPYSMLKDLKENGHIPTMKSLFETGYFSRMSVCIPEISSVSWSSFMTGTQSAEHGIFGFIDLEPGTYTMYFPNFTNLRSQTLWEDLAATGKQSVVINMPSTYPARKINGALISGFVAIDINKAVFPSSLIPRLKEMDYRIDIDTAKARQDPEFMFHDLDTTLENRWKAADYLWKECDWDLFIVVITGTDRLLHFMWDAYENKNHVHHQYFLDYFKKVDDFVARIHGRFLEMNGSKQGQNQFFMLSDHGFTGIKTEVYLNRWLHENGYLNFNKQHPETIMDIGEGSKAFTLDPSRIYINLKDKYPMGVVSKDDYRHLCNEIKLGLENLVFEDGSRVVKKVFNKEELYNGPFINHAPDLVVLSHHGYDLKGRVSSKEIFDLTGFQGMHTQDDAFVYSSNGKKANTIFELKDIIFSDFS